MGKKFTSKNGKTYHIPTVQANIEAGICDIADIPEDVQAKIRKVQRAEPAGVVISGNIVRETEKAICFDVKNDDNISGKIWFPKSQISEITDRQIRVSDWIYNQKCAE